MRDETIGWSICVSDSAQAPARARETRHRRWGWTSLAFFVAVGLLLESLHGFKVGYYLDVDNETRRTMWRLAHAHGTLLALVQLAYAGHVRAMNTPGLSGARPAPAWVSTALIVAQVLLPLGFFAGGLVIHAGDPGLGILAVPVGGIALLAALVRLARAQWPA